MIVCFTQPRTLITVELGGGLAIELSSEQQELQRAAIEFARSELNRPHAQADALEIFNREGWDACGRFGVFGMPVPQEYGGLGLGLSALLAVMEGLGYGTRDQGLLFSINAHLWTNSIPILLYGSDEQRQRYLPGVASESIHVRGNGIGGLHY